MKDRLNPPSEMTVGKAQAIVLCHADSLLESIKYINVRDKDIPHQRLNIYEEVGRLVINKNLPEDKVKTLVGKIFFNEWRLKKPKLFLNFLSDHNCMVDYCEKEKGWDYYSEVFEEASMIFPQFVDIAKERFSLVLDTFKKTREPSFFNNFIMDELFLVEAADFGDEEKRMIAKSWLAGYLVEDKKVFQKMCLAIPEDRIDDLVYSMLSEYFNLNNDDINEVAQGLLDKIDKSFLSQINNFVANINSSSLIKIENLNFEDWNANKLVEIFKSHQKDARRVYYRSLNEENEETTGFLRGNLAAKFALSWLYEMSSELSFSDKDIDTHLNTMNETDYFSKLDKNMLGDTKKLADKLNIDSQEIDDLLKNLTSSDQITREMQELFKKPKIKKEVESEESRKKRMEAIEKKEKEELEQALETLLMFGVTPE